MALKSTIIETALEAHRVTSIGLIVISSVSQLWSIVIISQLIYSDLQRAPHVQVPVCLWRKVRPETACRYGREHER